MKTYKRWLWLLILVFLTGVTSVCAQDNNGAGAENKDQAVTGRAARRKAKKEWKKNRKTEMQDAQSRKEYNKKYNTKKTRKRMKKNEKRAKRNNEHKREFFLVRWFKHKR